MEVYFLKSAACLAFLMLFYKLLLEREKMHLFKRIYLLGAVTVSLIIPFITFTTYVEANPGGLVTTINETIGASKVPSKGFDPNTLALSIYILGVLFFTSVFIRNLRSIILKIRKNPKLKQEDTINVLLQEEVVPHTFWDYIFLNKSKYEARAIPKEVLEHEQAHARQKHSIDILLIEILQIILWFYPLIYMVRSAIKLNHEFLADEAVLKKGLNRAAYQKTLLSFSSNELHSNLVNPINYSIIKKRFTVMKTKTSKTRILLRTFLLGPLLLGLIYGFSSTKTIERPLKTTTEVVSPALPISIQEKATRAMVKEYNAWAKQVNAKNDPELDKKTLDRMRYIYSIMTPRQKKKSEKFPVLSKEVIVIRKKQDRDREREMIRHEERQIREEQRAERLEARHKHQEVRQKRMEIRQIREEIKHEEGLPAPAAPHAVHVGEIPEPPLPPKHVHQMEHEIEMEIEGGSPPPPAPEFSDENIPSPPPPPPSPVEHMKELAAEGAQFFYNGIEVSGKKAVEIVKDLDKIYIDVKMNDNKQKVVNIKDSK